MMKQYSEKELKVFNAVYQLVEQGQNIKELRVQDIAIQADMGKGSLYEYFSSKDEILLKSVRYYITNKICDLHEMMDNCASFEENIRLLLKYKCSEFKVNHVLLQNLEFNFMDNPDITYGVLASFKEYADKLIDLGIKEGSISKENNRQYQHHVIASSVCSYMSITYLKAMNNRSEYDVEIDIENTVKMIIRSLN